LIGGYLTSSPYSVQMQTAATYPQVDGVVYDANNDNELTETYMGAATTIRATSTAFPRTTSGPHTTVAYYFGGPGE
jgi:hypothetical protein